MPMGAAPMIPGLTQTSGVSPESMSPMQMVAMMLGNKPMEGDSTTDKMSQIIQLLREVGKEDPKLSMLTSDALRLLTEGPSAAEQAGGPVAPGGNGTPGSVIPMGGPGVTG